MPTDANRVTEFSYTVEGQLSKLTAYRSEAAAEVTRWIYGTSLAESGVASNSLLRAKVYPDSDDPGPGEDGADLTYDRVEFRYKGPIDAGEVGTDRIERFCGIGTAPAK